MQTTSALPPSQTVIGSDVTAFLNSSVGGGAITAYDQAGSPANIQFRWAKVRQREPRHRPFRYLEPVL